MRGLRISVFLLCQLMVAVSAFASMPDLKLPFEAGETMPMTHGYWNGSDGNDSHHFATDHYALDFGGCNWFSKPVVATASGVVSVVVRDKVSLPTEVGREDAGYGNYVILDHGDGYFSRYAHLNEVHSYVQKGAPIIQGQEIGRVGDTGYAIGAQCFKDGKNHYGVHLHFALFKNGQGVKPEPMSGKVGFSSGVPYTSDNDPKGWAKSLVSTNRWIYWKINPSNPACASGSNHVIDDLTQGTCIQVSASDCPATPNFILPVDEAFGGGSESSGSPPVTGGTNSGILPNLIPNNSDIENASKVKVTTLHINEHGFCRMQTKNIGNKDAGAFQSRCFISDGYKIDSNPRDEGKEDTQGLAKGATHTEHEDFIAPEFPGTYNAVWCTDSANQVTESNEGDDCHTEDVFTVWSNPNVLATSVSIVGGKTILLPGETYSVDTTILNAGENFGRTILVGYYLDGVLIGTDHIKRENLKGGVSKVENLSVAIAPSVAGMHTLQACPDFDNRIAETNESDNCKSMVFEVQNPAPPPLPPPPPQPTPPPTPITQEEDDAMFLQMLLD